MRESVTWKSLTAALLAAICACAWSREQSEVLEAFSTASRTLRDGRWDAAQGYLSTSTLGYLDSLSRDFSARGMEGYGSSEEMLRVMYQEYIDFDGEVTMIFVDGEGAEVTVSAKEEGTLSTHPPGKYRLVLEQGDWKLDLTDVFRSGVEDALRGSYVR